MKSNVKGVGCIPSHVNEEVHGEDLIEWYLAEDEPIFIRLKPGDLHDEYIVEVITGINEKREQNVVASRNQLSWNKATDLVSLLIYAMNGTQRTITGDPEFNYPMDPPSEDIVD